MGHHRNLRHKLFGGRLRSGGRGSRRGGGGAGLCGIGGPIMTAALLTDPELIRLPGGSWRRVPEIHLIAATLAANLYAHIAHACDSIVEAKRRAAWGDGAPQARRWSGAGAPRDKT
jgi:hypothetical protein